MLTFECDIMQTMPRRRPHTRCLTAATRHRQATCPRPCKVTDLPRLLLLRPRHTLPTLAVPPGSTLLQAHLDTATTARLVEAAHMAATKVADGDTDL